MESEIKILKDFVEGKVSDKELEQQLEHNNKLEELLSDSSIDWSGTYIAGTTPYLYLAELKIQTISGRLNAQGLIELFLEKKGVTFNNFSKYAEDYKLIQSSQPKYIDAAPEFIEKYIIPQESNKTKSDLKKEVKERFERLFKFQTKPPKWIQNPNWIIKNDKPLFFLGQFEIKNCDLFHDNGAVYLFVNQETGEIETVTQFY